MKLVKNVSWIFSANLIVSLFKWLIIVIIARVLTPEEVGAYSLAFAIGAPVTLFANMKLRSLYITNEQNNFSNYMYARNILSIFAFIVILLVAIIIYPQYFYVIILVGLTKVFDLQSDIYYALPHKMENMDYIGKLMIVKHITTFIAFFLSVLITNSLEISLLVQLILQILFLFLVEKKKIELDYNVHSRNMFVFKDVKNVLLIGIPLGFVQMMVSFNSQFPRYMLEVFESTEVLGYFSAIAYILIIGNMLINAVSQIFLPRLSRKINNREYISFQKDLFINLSIFSLILGGCLVLFSFLYGSMFLNFVYGEEYMDYTDILILMSLALSINFISWNFDTALLAMRYISVQPKISIFILIVNILLGYFLISEYGIYGATYTIIITNSLQLVLRYFFVNLKLKALKVNDCV